MRFTALTAACICAVAANAAPIARAQDEGAQLQLVLQKHAPAIVTLRVLGKMSGTGTGGADQQSPLAMQGVVVTPEGLVMISNLPFSPGRAMELMGMGSGRQDVSSMKVTPTAIKIMFAGDEKEYDGFLAATDTNLDLGFVQIEGLEGRKLSAVDFSTGAVPSVGQRVMSVSRLQKGYDYAPFVQSGRVIGEISKPRPAYIMEGGITGFGLPVFGINGQVVGALTTVVAPSTDDASANSGGLGMMFRMITGGGGPGGAFILPPSTVKAVIDQATKRSATLAVERAKKKASGAIPPPVSPKPAVRPGTAPRS